MNLAPLRGKKTSGHIFIKAHLGAIAAAARDFGVPIMGKVLGRAVGKSIKAFKAARSLLKATRGAATVAETAGPKLLSAIPARVTNAANHIFGPRSLADHNLGGVLNAFKGDATAAFYQLENAAQALANRGAISGQFQTTVGIAGANVAIRGAVIDGIARVGTAFIP